MAITFYDDIQSPKLELRDSNTVFVLSLQASSLTEDSVYYLPATPDLNGKVLSSTSLGAMSWIDVASQDYIASRSGNLISNFSGHFGDNTNFSNFTYDPLYSPPSFKTTSTTASLPLDELIVVDPNETYKMSVWTKWLETNSGSYSMGLQCLDVDGRVIKAKHTMYKAGTTTYVTQNVAVGDDYIYVNSIANWNETGTDEERSFIFWDEVSEEGYAYPSETYSRHVLQNAWDSSTPFDENENRIELRESWDIGAHGPLPVVNTIVSNGAAQGGGATDHEDKYMMNTLTSVTGEGLLFAWTQHTGTIGGVDTSGTGVSSKFFPGTHSVKPKWEMVGASTNTVVFNNLFFGRSYSSDGGNADNIGNSNLYITPDNTATYRRLYLSSTGGDFSIYKQQGGEGIIFGVSDTSVSAYRDLKIKSLDNTSSNKLIFEGNASSGTSNVISLQAPGTISAPNSYTLPAAYPGANGYVLSSTTTGTMSWQAGGTVTGEDSVYHTIENDTYYYDSLAGSKHLAMILQNRRSDIIQHGDISVLQVWSEAITDWVTLTLPEDQIHYDGVKALLDGRRDTGYNVPNGTLKFRFQVEVSTTWPHQTIVALQTGWTAADWTQPQILVEEYSNSQWDVLVTADFTNANGVTNWGLSAYASQGLHTGDGGSGLTRITVDFSGFVSETGSTTVPLQNLYISSNYGGDENTGPAYHDYNNIINYDRDLVIPNSIRHEGNSINHIALGTNSQTYYTNDVERALINDAGFRLGGFDLPDGDPSATVTGIDPDVTLGGTILSSSHELLVTQKAVKVYINGLLYDNGSEPTGDDLGLSPGMVGDGTVSSAQWGFLNTISGNVQSQLSAGAANTTANAAAITAIQDTLKDSTGGGGKGVYTDSGKAQTSSYLAVTTTKAILQAGANTAYNAEESSPGTLTMSVQAGGSGNEVSVDAITIAGSSSVHNATTTFNQRAVFSMVADFDSTANFNSTVDLNGNATGISTNQVTEGTNLYYTDARAQAAITFTDAGGLGSLQFSGGTLTYTGPSDAEIHASYEFGTNMHVTDVVDSGTGRAVKQIAATYDNTEVQTYLSGGSATTIETSGDVTVGGNLIVSGTQTQLNTTTLEVEDINIVVGKLATTSTLTNGAGLTFGAWSSGTIPTLTWDHANTRLSSNKNFYAPVIKTGGLHLDNSGSPVEVTSPITINFQIDDEDRLDVTTSGITVSGTINVIGNITLSGTVDGIDIATDVAANTAKTGITSAQAAEITANTAQASAITANTAKTGITVAQANEISANTLKVSNVSTALGVSRSSAHFSITSDGNSIGLDSASSTQWGIMTDEQVVNLEANTLKTGITSGQASAITANTAKISYTDASAVSANTAKISYSTAASDAVALNTAKTGITSSQASEITANTAKVSNIVQTTITGNAGTATQLAQTVTIGGEDFDGDQSIDLPGVNETGNQDTTGNAATATTLATARNIGGVSFNGSAAITLPGVDAAGTQDTSGNAATATKIASITNTDIVQLAGAQTLSGVKTFSSSIVSPGITSASNGDIVIDPDGTGSITLRSDNIIFEGAGTMTLPSLKLSEATLLEGNYVGFGPPLSITANTIWTLPDGDGTAGQVMKTSGAGVLSWTSVLDGVNDTLTGTISVKPVGGIDGRIAFYEDGSTNYVLLQANNSLATNYTLYLPTADGSADQVLKTDGSGNLGWSTPSSGGGAVDMPLMTLGGRVQHSTTYDNRMIICGGTYGPTYYIWSSPAGVTTSGGGTVDSTTFTLSTSYQHYGAIRVPTAGQIKVDFLAKPLNSSSYSKPYVLQVWEFTPAIDTSTGPTCTLRGKVDMTSSDSTSKAVSATITTTSDVAAGSYIFVTIGMDAQTLTTTAYQYMNINLSILA